MPKRYSTSVDVDLFLVYAKLSDTVYALSRKRFVNLSQSESMTDSNSLNKH